MGPQTERDPKAKADQKGDQKLKLMKRDVRRAALQRPVVGGDRPHGQEDHEMPPRVGILLLV